MGDREGETGSAAFCIFERAGRRLAVGVEATRGIVKAQAVTPIPLAPAHLAGLVNAGGEALPLVLLDAWLGPVRAGYPADAPVLMIESEGVRIGVLVDRISGVESLPAGEAAEAADEGICMRGSGAAPAVTVLDPVRLVRDAVSLADAAFGCGPSSAEAR